MLCVLHVGCADVATQTCPAQRRNFIQLSIAQEAVAWAATEETGLSGRAGEWIEDVMSRGDLSAVDGAREIGIGPGAEQVRLRAPFSTFHVLAVMCRLATHFLKKDPLCGLRAKVLQGCRAWASPWKCGDTRTAEHRAMST